MALPPKRRRLTDEIKGLGEEIRFAIGRSSVGSILAAFSNKGVVAILIREDRDQLLGELQECFPQAHLVPGDRVDKSFLAQVIAYAEKPERGLDLPLDLRGTAFQKRVWRAVQKIPLGETSTYTAIARAVGAPKAMRAVGNTCSNNLLALAIPCHRVLRSDGSLSGWSRQAALLQSEGAKIKGSKK